MERQISLFLRRNTLLDQRFNFMAGPEATPEVPKTNPPGQPTPPDAQITHEDQKQYYGRNKGPAPDLPSLLIDDINFAQSNFDRLDGDNNGFVSLEEIKGFEKANKNLSEADKSTLKKLSGHMDQLEGYSRDESSWWENDGFTRKDLMVAKTDSKIAARSAEGAVQPRTLDNSGEDIRQALNYVNKNFDKLDADKNGSVSAKEINDLTTTDSLSSSELRMMRNLSTHYDTVAEASKDSNGVDERKGITRKDLAAANENVNTLTFALEKFGALDANGDGYIAKKEISGYERAKEDLSAAELKNLHSLADKVDSVKRLNSDGYADNTGASGHDLVVALTKLGAGNATGQFKLSEQTAPAASAAPETRADKENPAPDNVEEDTVKNYKAPTKEKVDGADTNPPSQPVEKKNEERFYSVKPNDSLWKICREDLRERYGGKEPSYRDILSNIDAMAAVNGIARDSIIQPGQRLRFPSGDDVQARAESNVAEPRRAERTVNAPTRAVPDVRERLENPADNLHRTRRSQTSTDVVRQHFDNMDVDGNGRVSEKEIRAYMNDFGPDISWKDRIALNRVARHAGKIQELANDEKGDENSGISYADLQKVDEMQEAARMMAKSGMWENFNTNGDKYLKKNEIEQALRRANITEDERRALNYLYDNYGKFQEGNNDEKGDENSGVTWNDLRWYSSFV